MDLARNRGQRLRTGFEPRAVWLGIAIFVSMGIVAGCTTKVGPTPVTNFLDSPGDLTAQPERFPFDEVWINPDPPRREYKTILIRRVDTDHMVGVDWTKEQPTTEQSYETRAAANGLAMYMWEQLRAAFYYDPNRRLEVVEEAGPDTLTIEMAIVRVVRDSFGKGTVAMEGRIRDAQSRTVVAKFRDQETGNRKKLVNAWALELVELANTPRSHRVKKRS